jgi:hypothetical protein
MGAGPSSESTPDTISSNRTRVPNASLTPQLNQPKPHDELREAGLLTNIHSELLPQR